MQIATNLGTDSQRIASIAFLESYREGRPLSELAELLPRELEATGQLEAAAIVRSFFASCSIPRRTGSSDPAAARSA